jgi:hypothetical protein
MQLPLKMSLCQLTCFLGTPGPCSDGDRCCVPSASPLSDPSSAHTPRRRSSCDPRSLHDEFGSHNPSKKVYFKKVYTIVRALCFVLKKKIIFEENDMKYTRTQSDEGNIQIKHHRSCLRSNCMVVLANYTCQIHVLQPESI